MGQKYRVDDSTMQQIIDTRLGHIAPSKIIQKLTQIILSSEKASKNAWGILEVLEQKEEGFTFCTLWPTFWYITFTSLRRAEKNAISPPAIRRERKRRLA